MNEKVLKELRLLKEPKNKILQILFSRAFLFLALILIELVLLFSIYNWFNTYIEWFVVIQWIFMIGMFFYLWNCNMDATSKMTWLLFLAAAPVPASILLLYTKADIGYRLIKKRLADLYEVSKGVIKQDSSVLLTPEIINSGVKDLNHYINLSGSYPIYKNSKVSYLSSGEEKFDALIEELRKAEKFIFLEYFIIEEGYMWGAVLQILKEKVAQGVDVRVMYDGMCEITSLSFDYDKRLSKIGIKCKPFSKIHPFISTTYNNRDHRKILVIDNKVAFNGGVNLADEYINKKERFGHWKDAAVMIKGEAVSSFTLMFLQMWNIDKKEPSWNECAFDPEKVDSDGFVLPFSDSPLDEYSVGENVYMDILNRAQKFVHIMTPYLILDNKMENALIFAAQRGIDVKLILPGMPDKRIPFALAKSHYKHLVESGVKIYEYTPGFVHAKVFVSDYERAVVGTINLDYRSLYHHFECATYLYNCSCINAIEMDFKKTLGKCRKIDNDAIQNEKLFYKIVGGIMKLVAPLM